jgi:glycosyltransferase involved in cell wall biosynthesis
LKKTPKISVGMPVYNGEAYLEESINCILNQTYEDFELIISDNASTDRTKEICQDFAADDQRISYVRNKENLGAAANYNQAFRLSSGEYYRWFNADDRCASNTHERCLEVLKANPSAVLCYGKTKFIDSDGKVTKSYEDNLDLQQNCVVDRYKTFFKSVGLTNIIYGLMRRSVLERTMLMGNGSFPAADTDFMAELTLYGTFIELSDTLFFRRMHERASSWDRKDEKVQQEFWKGKNHDFVFPTWRKKIANLKAIRNSPISYSAKAKLQMFIVRRMIWQRRFLFNEILQEAINIFNQRIK